MYFDYGEKEINYLKKKDKRLGEAIDKIGCVALASVFCKFSNRNNGISKK